MRIVVKLFGVFPLLVIDTMDDYEDEVGPAAVGGGSAHNFERDYFPLSPTHHHEWEWEDKNKKGFGFR